MARTTSGKPVRMRQEERSRVMRERLLEATLKCLGEVGYAGMAISAVAARAGVSRGAISHHFPTKLDLAAAAMSHLFEARHDRLYRALVEEAPQGLSLDARLDIFRAEFTTMLSADLEVLNTLRTNAELRARVLRTDTPGYDERLAGYLQMFADLGAGPQDRSVFISVLVAFLRGLGIESLMLTDEGGDPRGRIDQMFEMFRHMVRLYYAAGTVAVEPGQPERHSRT